MKNTEQTMILMHCEVVLDELPFGWFCEIEGVDHLKLFRQLARKMGLRWEARILNGYWMIFEQWKENMD